MAGNDHGHDPYTRLEEFGEMIGRGTKDDSWV
jgi:hypothetical protein